VGVLAALPSAAAIGAPAPATTKSQIRSQPPDVTDRKLKGLVWSLFEKQDHRGRKPPTRPLSGLYLRTKTQATHVPGLCRYDSVRVEFEPLNGGDEGPDAPVRPVGLTSTSNFTFLSDPPAEYRDVRQDRLGSAGQCSSLPKDRPFFGARDEETATDGYRAWLALRESIRAGRKFPLECNLTRLDSEPCEAVVAALKPERLSDVETCESELGTVCHALYFEDRMVRVLTTGHVYPGPRAGIVLGAKLESLIVLTHEVVD
jgi:hypothetical protein